MALVDILVLLDRSPAAERCLLQALGHARKHGAGVTCLALPLLFAAPPPGRFEHEAFVERFAPLTAAAGVPLRWLDTADFAASPFQALYHAVHGCSLVVIGQDHPDVDPVAGGLPERLVLAGGRPVLVVPYAGGFASFGDRVLVAWNDGRESTRSLHDAMPLLVLAQRVELAHLVGEPAALDGAPARLALIVDYLARAGIKAGSELLPSFDFPLADMLLNRACDGGYDLLVMGAYGAVGGKPVLGSMARHLLQHMTLPVLMSH